MSVSVHLVRDRLPSATERCAKQMDNTDHLCTAILKPASGIRFFPFLSHPLHLLYFVPENRRAEFALFGSSFAVILPFLACHAHLLVLSLIIFTAVAFN